MTTNHFINQRVLWLLIPLLTLFNLNAWGDGSLVTGLSGISSGQTYYITAYASSKYYVVPNTTISGQTFSCTERTVSSSTLTSGSGDGEFVFTSAGVTNAYYIYNTNLKKYLVATGSKAFGYVDDSKSSNYGYWTFSDMGSGQLSGQFSVTHSGKTHYMRSYNGSVKCYDGTSNSGVYLFQKQSGYTLTFKETGGSNNGSGLAAANATSMTISTAPTPATGKMVEGYYAENTLTTKIANADGSWAASNIAGWVTSGQFTKGAAANLYIKWTDLVTTVTLDKGTDGTTDGTATITYNATSFTSKTDATKTGYHLSGYYTTAGGGSKVINADGSLVSSLSGWTSSSQWIKNASTATLYAHWTIDDYTVSWSVNGESWTTGVSSSNNHANYKSKITSMPTDPTSSNCDNSKVFVGWTKSSSYSSATTPPSDLFTTVAGSPTITGNTTFYAVFATADANVTAKDTWKKISSTSQITDGMQVLLINKNSTTYYAINSSAGATSITGVGSTTFTTNNNALRFAVEKGVSNYKFKTLDGKYLSTSAQSNNTTLQLDKTYDTWTISSDAGSETGTFNLVNSIALEYYSSTLKLYGWSDSYKQYFRFVICIPAYTNYATSCCTALGSINGSVSWTNPTEAVLTWNAMSNVDATTPYTITYRTGSDAFDDDNVGSISTNGAGKKTCTITGLSCNTDYDFKIAITAASGYCDKDSVMENKNSGNWDVEYTLTDSKATKTTGPTSICAEDFEATFTPITDYHLPTDITVTIGGASKTKGTDYTWTIDGETGVGTLSIDDSDIDGDISITVTAVRNSCPSFAFWYGTTKGDEDNYECLSQVSTSTTWLTDLWTIPSADQWTYIGDPSWITTYSGNLKLSDMKYALNRSCALGSIGTNVMEGAQGYIRIYSDNTTAGENKYVGFIPAGYVLRWGTDGEGWNSKPFTAESNDIDEEDWNTALQTWTSSNADDYTYVGLKTSSGYVWANRSETRRPVFLKPTSAWDHSNAYFAIYYFDASSHTGWSAIMTDPDGDGIYEAWIPNDYTYTTVNFVRLSTDATGWGNKWNQTGDITLPSDKNVFTITGGSGDAYTGSWSLYDKKGTFHISANSNTNNWYCHFLPHHVLTYNANGGSGAPTTQSVAIDAATKTLTVAAGSGMTPPTGYSFIGWNPDESEADAGNVDSDYDPNDTPTMSGDITLYAVWQANSIALTLDKNNSDASGSSNGSGSIDYDATSGTITTAATRTGYHVEGYYAEPGCTNKVLEDDGDVINSTVSGYTSSGKWARTTDPTTLYTKWTANEYTISLDDQSATTAASINSITVTFNANTNLTGTVVATRPTKTGYQFGGYYTGTSGSGVKIIDTDGTVVASVATYTDASKNWIKASDVDLYAYWLPIYAITWSVNGSALTGDALDGASTGVVSGGTISGVPSTAPADNTLNNCANKFMGWSATNITKGSPVTDADDIAALGLFTEASGYTTAISGPTTFYAVFAESSTPAENTILWREEFGYASGGAKTAPSDGATVYAGTLTYTMNNGKGSSSSNTEVQASDHYAGSSAPELMIGKGGTTAGSFVISGIPKSNATKLTLTFKKNNNTLTPTVSNGSITKVSGSGAGLWEYTITCGNSATFNLTLTGSTGSNVRVDSIVLKVKTPGYTNYVTQCADNQVRVTYDFNGGTGTACTEGVTTKSASYTVCSTEPDKDYYDFAGWNDGTSTYDAGDTYNLQATTEFEAQWTPTVYTITYNLNGGTQQVTPAAPTSYTYESSAVTLPTPTKNHDRFDGWYANVGLTGDVQTTIAAGSNGSKEYWAKWTTRNEIKFYADDNLLATIYRAADENLQASVAGQGSKPDDPDAPSACSSKVFMGWTETWFNDETDTEPADLNNATGTRSGAKTYYAVWATRAGSPGSYTYSAYSTTCCGKSVEVDGGSPSNGTVTFDKSYAWTCKGDREIVMTITPAAGYQLHTFSVATGDGKVAAKSMSADVVLDNNSSAAQVITLTFAKDANGAYDVTATFTEMTVTSWTWTYNSSDIPDPIDVYVGQKRQIDVVMSPSGVLSSHKNNLSYTYDVNSTYIGNPNRASTYFTFEGKAATESTTITLTHNDDTSSPKAFPQTVNVRVKPLPLVHFVDNVHNESFDDVVATVSGDKLSVSMVKTTPTHVDFTGSTANSCEETHLHLIGWIRGDWPAYVAYMNGTGDAPSNSDLTGATGYFYAPGAEITLTDAMHGMTFYAIWAKVE